MCVFIYTRPERCGHTLFQNIAECPVARGIPHPHTLAHRHDATLPAPRFLFDTARSKTHTPELYARIFACPKRKAVRPLPGALCDECDKKQKQKARLETVEEVGEKAGKLGRLVVPKMRFGKGRAKSASSGSSVAFMGGDAAASASSTTSSLNTDTSTPRSFWKMARPSEVV